MAFQKVMISGIHTSELTVLKEEEKMALLREIQETGSKAARDKLIQGNLRLVLAVVFRSGVLLPAWLYMPNLAGNG